MSVGWSPASSTASQSRHCCPWATDGEAIEALAGVHSPTRMPSVPQVPGTRQWPDGEGNGIAAVKETEKSWKLH